MNGIRASAADSVVQIKQRGTGLLGEQAEPLAGLGGGNIELATRLLGVPDAREHEQCDNQCAAQMQPPRPGVHRPGR